MQETFFVLPAAFEIEGGRIPATCRPKYQQTITNRNVAANTVALVDVLRVHIILSRLR